MEYNAVGEADFLIHQETLYIGSLVTGQLNNFAHVFVLLHGTVTGEILLECFADSLNVEIVSEASDSCDTFTTVPLLHWQCQERKRLDKKAKVQAQSNLQP